MITLEFSDNLTQLLNELALEAKKGFKVELRKAGMMIRDANVNRLKKGYSVKGGRLAKLSPATVEIKGEHGASNPKRPLNYTGELLQAVRDSRIDVVTQGKLQYVTVSLPDGQHSGSPHEASLPMSMGDLVNLHHFGGKSSWGKDLPARPFWGMSKKTQNEILRYFRKRIKERWGKTQQTATIGDV